MYTKLISIKTYARFLAILESNDPIPNSCVVIIEDTKQIWTHGVFINGISITKDANDNIELTSQGTSYGISGYYHKKLLDIDLGTYLNNIGRTKSYVLKAGLNNLLQYTEEVSSRSGIHIGNGISNIFVNSTSVLNRFYVDGTSTYTYPILDTSNVSISLNGNKLSYNFGGITGNVYLVRQDTNNTLPENDAINRFSRLGGSNIAGWIVMNTSSDGDGDYYALKVTNTDTPELYIKRASGTTYTRIISEHDVFTGASTTNGGVFTNGTKGIVPAPTNPNMYLKGDGTWSSVFPTLVPGCYLHVSSAGLLEWVTDESSSYTDITLTSISLQTSWSNIDDLTSRLGSANGSYAILIIYGSRMYTGMFSYTNNGYDIDDEIVLHCSGTRDSVGGVERGRLYAKIHSNNNTIYLLMATSQSEDNAVITIKYKKLI